jgi:hypothetical protein
MQRWLIKNTEWILIWEFSCIKRRMWFDSGGIWIERNSDFDDEAVL